MLKFDIQKGKPDPEIYDLACKKLNINKGQAVVFEDSKNGIESAKNAGLFCIAILTKGLNDDFAHLADHIIEDFNEVFNSF